ncbi:hypothetical protein Fullmetal_19 [Microbacterium phage Fullmetal]|nr:hypothetical protein SEA_ATRAXI_18 [Microbacterium phage Atraxi]UQT01703.1 hypothetical protein SEA_MORRILL_18 [Microbacterium phage Morrill]UXE04108.1 hypothetical protein Fullmetal_19 [Microbacterium phage Fullmetal]
MAVIIISRQKRQHKIAARAQKARLKREHRAWHMEQANIMRQQADHMKASLDQAEGLTFEERENYEAQIINLRALALETENAQCMEDHH